MDPFKFIPNLENAFQQNLLHYKRSSTISIEGPDGVVGVAIRAEHLGWQQLGHQYTCDILGKIFILEVADSMGPTYKIDNIYKNLQSIYTDTNLDATLI